MVGAIRADREQNADAECYRVVLNVHPRGGAPVQELPTEEYEEEEPDAAVVLEARGRWFKLRLNEGTAWLQASDDDKYFPLEHLLHRRNAYLTEAWDGRLAAIPGGSGQRPPADPRRRLVGYIEPVLGDVRIVLAPGQAPEQIQRQYRTQRGSLVRAFERADRSAPVVASFPTENYDRALRAVLWLNPPEVAVFERRPGWFQVALRRDEWRDEPRAWIEDAQAWRFHAFESDTEREAFENRLFGREHSSVRLIESRKVGEALWLHIEVMSHTMYESLDPPTVVAAGWVPAHGPAGESIVWFYSRD
jgi:hypothetical protein